MFAEKKKEKKKGFILFFILLKLETIKGHKSDFGHCGWSAVNR